MGRKITAKKDQTDGALMMAAYTAVSYTHLDVYKRQIVGSAIVKIIEKYGENAAEPVYNYVKEMADAVK